MPARMDNHRGRHVAAALGALLALLATPYAQQPPPAQPPAGQKPPAQQPPPPPLAPGTPPKPLVPLAASTVAENPDPYYGEYVTVTAAVEQILSRTSFSIDQDATKSTGKEVLVIAPNMNGKVDTNWIGMGKKATGFRMTPRPRSLPPPFKDGRLPTP